MTEKRFTTVELQKPNKWGIWYDGVYLSTYQVCTLLNEYVDVRKENEQLKKENHGIQDKVIRLLDYVEVKQCVTRTEIKKWWNGDVE